VIVTTRYGRSRATAGSTFTFTRHTLLSVHGGGYAESYAFTAPPSGVPWTVNYTYGCPPADPEHDDYYTVDLRVFAEYGSWNSELAAGLPGWSGSGTRTYSTGGPTVFSAWYDDSDPYSTICNWSVSIVG
jgi:hypothetical protein